MKNRESIQELLFSNKLDLKERFAIKTLSLFGSYVRNDQTENSDLNVLVEFEEAPSFFEFIRIEIYLTNLIGVKVDLVMKNALKPNIGKQIIQEAIAI